MVPYVNAFISTNVLLAVFNLLPVPPASQRHRCRSERRKIARAVEAVGSAGEDMDA